jgi:hypothetical protein
MIDRKQLLADLKPLVKEVEIDLRARCDEVAQINEDLQKEYDQARKAERTGVTFEEWRADLITQVAVAWVLSCVFVRFLEDNALIAPPRISGPLHGAGADAGLQRARDERETYFKTHPRETDRDYLLAVFDDLAKLKGGGAKDIFGPHNSVSAYRNWLSGDAAQKLIEFFQKIDTDGTGEIIHDFTDPAWDTRFLGDLYQDLSEAARKKYALLQTPVFVEEFILERTLEPAINEFGLKDFKMIDPACGSGHFLLGGFARILKHWRAKEPGTSDRELVNRALTSVHGVDLNPYAIAIARFRLLLAAMRECQITKLMDAPAFAFNLACGDSLLHGSLGGEQQLLGFHELAHVYQSEDLAELRRILKAGQYQAVVANPPYITVKDKALNQAYRERYPEVCYRLYSLSVPFLQRLFNLACEKGFTGQITANSFMKREFGKKLIESYLPKIDLTHVIDTSGAYLPGFGTPTVILFGRNRKPVAPTVRAVLGIKGEPSTPADPALAFVWTAIIQQVDHAGSQSVFVSVDDTLRGHFERHPWSIGGGGAAELKEQLDAARTTLACAVESMGFYQDTHADDVFVMPPDFVARHNLRHAFRAQARGDEVRDWAIDRHDCILFPYDDNITQWTEIPRLPQWAWLFEQRVVLRNRSTFGGTYESDGRPWFDFHQFPKDRARAPMLLVFGEVVTHNHFALNRGAKVFNRTAPVLKLPADATEDDHLALLGLLNSSTACFWLKQACHNKGSSVDDKGARQRTAPFEDFFAFNATRLEQFPLPLDRPLALARQLDGMAGLLSDVTPSALLQTTPAEANREVIAERHMQWECIRQQMIALQEELDWNCYGLYGLIDHPPLSPKPPALRLGERAFEIVLARRMAAGEEESTWFARHGSMPITDIPADWPEAYRKVVQRRIEIIESNANIALIERPEYKRRWNTEPWEEQQGRALRGWLLTRLESYFDIDGRMNDRKEATARNELQEPRLTSVAKVADVARADKDFMQVAEIFTDRMDFDVGTLVGELVAAESVPALPGLRYKPAAMDKRAAWERTWDLQRLEDAVDALFEIERLKKIAPAKAEETLRPLVAAIRIDETAKPQVLREAVGAAGYVTEAVRQKLNLTIDTILKPIQDTAKRAKKAAVGDIPVPPKYTSADFLSTNFWRLRGKLDVPKERWVSFPHCEGEDGTLVIAWAGYDHLQLARAIAERYELAKEREGRKLVPLLAAIGQLLPWLTQWHNEMDPAYGTRMGDYFKNYLAEEAKALDMNVEKVMAWIPPEKPKKAGRRKKADAAAKTE